MIVRIADRHDLAICCFFVCVRSVGLQFVILIIGKQRVVKIVTIYTKLPEKKSYR